MSNLSKTKNQLKKKLTFDDYSKPVRLHKSKPAKKKAVKPPRKKNNKLVKYKTSKLVKLKTGIPAEQQKSSPALQPRIIVDTPANQNISKTVQQNTSLTPSHQQTSKISSPVQQQTVAPASQPTSKKVKATFYLSEDVEQALTDVFIKRLQARNKTDKSALISEAIRLLYKEEGF